MVGWRRGEERRGTVWRSKGGGEGMCDDMRCEVFPDSVITCIKDSLRERETEKETEGERNRCCAVPGRTEASVEEGD